MDDVIPCSKFRKAPENCPKSASLAVMLNIFHRQRLHNTFAGICHKMTIFLLTCQLCFTIFSSFQCNQYDIQNDCGLLGLRVPVGVPSLVRQSIHKKKKKQTTYHMTTCLLAFPGSEDPTYAIFLESRFQNIKYHILTSQPVNQKPDQKENEDSILVSLFQELSFFLQEPAQMWLPFLFIRF